MDSEFVTSFTTVAGPGAAVVKEYAEALELYLSQALEAEAEGEYWGQVEGSTVGLCVCYVHHPSSSLLQQVKSKRKALQRIRDERAQTLGMLVHLKPRLLQPQSFLPSLHATLAHDSPSVLSQHLRRPPWYIRHLPSLLLLPPLSLCLYSVYPSLVHGLLATTSATLRGFITNWLVDPILNILHTIRSGTSASSSLVHDQTVQADLESLQQMSVSLLSSNLTPAQLSHFSSQILTTRDITPVLQIHTSASSTPLSSLLLPPSTLLHTLLIQLQKAKVDLDFALQGISHLLKSQQLTFGFVGVAPALVLVYLLSGAAIGLWRGTAGWGRWGGKSRRRALWTRLRRVERILNAESAAGDGSPALLAPLPTGLMILSLTKLRSYALLYLPPSIREPFIEDLRDLEDPMLGTRAKLRVVNRMWRSWGGPDGVILNPYR